MNVTEHLKLLGFPVKDRVTGFAGIVTTVGFDLYGCIQGIVSPGLNEKGEPGESRWFDITRLECTAEARVMEPPSFAVAAAPGGYDKPVR